MKTFWILSLILCAAAMIGCAVPAKQMMTEDGKPIYVGQDGKATLEQTDPATNAPNEPLMETDVEKIEGIADAAKNAGSKLPEPFGLIVGGLLGVIGSAGVSAFRKSREKARAKAKAELEAKAPVVAT